MNGYATNDGSQRSSVHLRMKAPIVKPKPLKPPPQPSLPSLPDLDDIFSSTSCGEDEFPPPPPEELLSPLTERSIEDELDALTDMLETSLKSSNEPGFLGACCVCHTKIIGESNGCTAMGRLYHVTCFLCGVCKAELLGKSFYSLNDSIQCEKCYENSLEVCAVCNQKITDAVIKTSGNTYHSTCFTCAGCDKSLDGIPFSLDALNAAYCVTCYQLRFSPRCGACHELITPANEKGEIVHIVSMDKNYHVECYKCEDCDTLLYGDGERGCYPLNGDLLCQQCNIIRLDSGPKQTMSRVISTDL